MTQLNRRQFVERTLLGAGALALGTGLSAAGEGEKKRASDRVPLGKTGLKVSRFGMGTGTNGWEHESNQTRAGIDSFVKVVRHAHQLGVNLFDAADMYGSHAYLKRALEGIPREDYVLVTKVNWREGKTPEKAIDRFRLELATDVLDVVLVHCAETGDWPQRDKEKRTLAAIQEAKSKGIVRAVGVSCHGMAPLTTALETPGLDYHLVRINHAGAIMDGKPEEVVPIIRKMHEKGRAVCGMKITGAGKLKDQVDASLKFVLGLGCVDTMIVGFERPEEIDDFQTRMERVLNGVA
jgi:aryl-alcohol dehydrogenase-like predicted oxidoreductase